MTKQNQLKTFYIASKADIMAFSEINNHGIEWHATPLDVTDPDGLQLVCFVHPDEYTEALWVSNTAVQALPHPLSNKGVKPNHQVLLKRFGIQPNDTTLDIANKAKDFHACMRVTGFW
jgi:hypothetical protein